MLAHIRMKRLSRLALLGPVLPLVLAAANDRIVDRVDAARTEVLRGQHHSQAISQNDRGPADPAVELSHVTLVLRPAPGLESFLVEQQTPASPNYRRWLTPEQFGDRFGLTPNDLAKLTGWLQSQGLRVHDVARGRHWITFSGSTAQIGRALHTEFHRYLVNGRMHIANASDPAVPTALAGVIAAFLGLDDFEPVEAHVIAPAFNIGNSHYLSPYDFATIYNVKPLWDAGIDGTGISIAVIGRSDINLSDIQSFRKRFGLPDNDPQVVLVPGTQDPGHTSSEIEADLDVQWSGAVAPKANIIYVNSPSVTTSLQYAIDQNLAPIMTYSYGSCEQFFSIGLQYFGQQANAQGITWMAASGDWGAATCDAIYSPTPQAALGPTLSVPANLPEVTAVGGTQFNEGASASKYWASSNDPTTLASALSYIPETVWNESAVRGSLVAGSGGPSAFLPKPWWQIGTPDDKVRDVPDISLTAGTHDPYTVISSNSIVGVGGTSASSPSFAGIVAMLNQYLVKQGVIAQPGLGNINPTLYRLAQSTKDVFHDIVDGDNAVPCVQSSPMCVNGAMGYAAVKGYDLATGLGTIDAHNLITEWNNGTASQTSLTADATTVKVGDTVKLTATVKGGGNTLPTGTVMFVCGDQTLGTATLAASADGASAAATLSVPAALVVFDGVPVYASYSGDSVYSSSSASTTVNVDITSGHSVVVAVVSPYPVPQNYAGVWPYAVALTEKAGVATKLTGFSINGTDNSSNIALLNKGVIPANGFVTASLQGTSGSIPSVPFDRTFVFSGQDADGTNWSQQITVTFTGPLGTYNPPSVSLVSTPGAVQQDPQADPACQWKQDFTLDEHAGYLMQLTKFTVGAVDFTGQIQQVFGTTRLAPFGTLHGTMCWASSNTVAPSSKTFTITGTAPTGLTATATVVVSYQPAPATTAAFSVSPSQVEMTVPDNAHNAGRTVALTFSGGSPSWQAAVLPANSTTSWLKVTPLSGNGSGQLTIAATTSGLSIGAYQASIAISAPGAVPGYLTIPVILVVGASSNKITAIVNAASYQPVFAPGMLAAVYGTALSPTTSTARTIPLPLKMSGVSATVNGIAAPVVGTFPDAGQLNIQVPYEAGSGPALLAVNNNGAISYYTFQIAAAAPGLFGVWDLTGKPATSVQQGQTVLAFITGEGDVTPFLATGATPASTTAVSRLPKARLQLHLTVGGEDAGTPLFSGIPSGSVGVTQINFTIPPDAPLGQQDVVVTVGGVASNPITLTVTPAPAQ